MKMTDAIEEMMEIATAGLNVANKARGDYDAVYFALCEVQELLDKFHADFRLREY
tara:strand:- start:695 stop:859 length:165 start_codon:yes stop_codon:yes gene_type:complete